MTRYLISFPSGAMDHIPREEFPSRTVKPRLSTAAGGGDAGSLSRGVGVTGVPLAGVTPEQALGHD